MIFLQKKEIENISVCAITVKNNLKTAIKKCCFDVVGNPACDYVQ